MIYEGWYIRVYLEEIQYLSSKQTAVRSGKESFDCIYPVLVIATIGRCWARAREEMEACMACRLITDFYFSVAVFAPKLAPDVPLL